jgi:hypothetical protein
MSRSNASKRPSVAGQSVIRTRFEPWIRGRVTLEMAHANDLSVLIRWLIEE